MFKDITLTKMCYIKIKNNIIVIKLKVNYKDLQDRKRLLAIFKIFSPGLTRKILRPKCIRLKGLDDTLKYRINVDITKCIMICYNG